MQYLSVCSGIEAATVAWHPLGWTPFGFSEIEAFPAAVLAHHYGSNLPGELWKLSNGVPNFGDMNNFKEWPDANLDVLVGGTPCQSFSVAGLRKGMADPRGNLALVYLAIADRYRPEWIVWENVPGVLSSSEGRDFGAFIGGLAELGYHAAWRVLDAQYVRVDGFGRAVPQRRRRVFVVGHLGDWRRAAAVLFEREGMSGNPAPRREAGKGPAPTLSARTKGGGGLGTDFDCDGGLIASTGDVSHCLNAGGMGRIDYKGGYAGRRQEDDINIVAFAQNSRDEVRLFGGNGSVVGALAAEPGMNQQSYVAFAIQAGALRENPDAGTDGIGVQAGVAYTLEARAEVQAVQASWAVRRLTPLECERLQGFGDGYTAIDRKGKPAADGPRYKALGNSMAVNAMRWLGTRIELINALAKTA